MELSKQQMQDVSYNIVEKIVDDLTDRRGLKNEWYQIDDDIIEEILSTWKEIAFTEIYKVVKYKDIVDG